MSEIAKIIGQRIRNRRRIMGLSQEKLAELCGCHHTYIGQIERGEKNATVESIARICGALDISMSQLLEKLGASDNDASDIPLKCYELIAEKNEAEQVQIYRILMDIDKYKETK